MKPIIRIAKLELNILFYSPIAWFLLTVLLFQCGMVFPDMLDNIVSNQLLQHSSGQLTYFIFDYPYRGMFPVISNNLYLYLPLITMGLISREMQSGTIKLLYSSPLSPWQIVLGKYTAMLVFNALLTAVMAILVIFSICTIQSPDLGAALPGLLGLYLIMGAYATVGLFMSSLTTYQVVAAIGTLAVLALMRYAGGLWQGIDFVRDLTYFLSIAHRAANEMYSGLITTRDVLYFLVIIGAFLGFTVCKLLGDTEIKPFFVRAGRYVLISCATLLIGYVISRPRFTGYYDATASKWHTLSPHSQSIFKDMQEGPLEITSYINLLDPNYSLGEPEKRNQDMARWEPYLRFKPDITFKYVYYYDTIPDADFATSYPGMTLPQIAKRLARGHHTRLSYFKTPAEIRRLASPATENNHYVMQLRYKGRSTFLRLFEDAGRFPGETEVMAAMRRLLSVRPPKIVFLQGHLERNPYRLNDNGYGMLTSKKTYRYALINQGFDVDSISLQTQNIPPDITALVLADPRVALDSAGLRKIKDYIDAGGNLLIAGEPGKQALLNPLLKTIGVQLRDGMLVQPHKAISMDVALTWLPEQAAQLSSAFGHTAEEDLPVSMPGAMALSYETKGPFTVQPLLVSDNRGWLTKSPVQLDSAAIRYDSASGDLAGAFPTALCLSRQLHDKAQRIIVLGDADVLSNVELKRWNAQTSNFDFGTAVFGWFTYDTYPIDTRRPRSKDNYLKLTQRSMNYVTLAFHWLLPGICMIIGTILLIRRNRR